jgi:hypothetical protein
MVTSISPVKEFVVEVPRHCEREEPEQKSGLVLHELSNRPNLSGLNPLSSQEKMSNGKIFPEKEVVVRLNITTGGINLNL